MTIAQSKMRCYFGVIRDLGCNTPVVQQRRFAWKSKHSNSTTKFANFASENHVFTNEKLFSKQTSQFQNKLLKSGNVETEQISIWQKFLMKTRAVVKSCLFFNSSINVKQFWAPLPTLESFAKLHHNPNFWAGKIPNSNLELLVGSSANYPDVKTTVL